MRVKSQIFFLFLVLSLCGILAAHQDFYKLLSIERTATVDQIKKAGRKLSLKYHPDRNRDNQQAKDKYIEIRRAVEVLSDKEMRHVYDTRGIRGLEEYEKNKGQTDHFGRPAGMQRGPNFQIKLTVILLIILGNA